MAPFDVAAPTVVAPWDIEITHGWRRTGGEKLLVLMAERGGAPAGFLIARLEGEAAVIETLFVEDPERDAVVADRLAATACRILAGKSPLVPAG